MNARLRWLSFAASCALVLPVAGCDRKREGAPRAGPEGAPLSASSISAASRPPTSASAGPTALDTAKERDEGPDTPPPSGGPWATCADGFRISGNPLRDVTRLGLLCGPATGMRRPEAPLERAVGPGEPWAFEVPVAAGECLRLVVASASAAGLTVSTTGAPSVTATVSRAEGWVVARPRGPLCADEASTVRVVVTSAAGGNLAVGRWFLPP